MRKFADTEPVRRVARVIASPDNVITVDVQDPPSPVPLVEVGAETIALLTLAERELMASANGPMTLAQQWIIAQRISGASLAYRHIPRESSKSPIAPSFVETALVLRILLCFVSFAASALLMLSYAEPADASPNDDADGLCRGKRRIAMYRTLYRLLGVGVLVDCMVMFVVSESMYTIWQSMLKGAAVTIVRTRSSFFSVWRMFVLYGVGWAPMCLVQCAHLSVSYSGDAACSVSDDMWRAWPSASIIILTVMSVFNILWGLFWLTLRIVMPQFRLSAIPDTRSE